jgi:ABC-type sugar transport system substrate-binding protein
MSVDKDHSFASYQIMRKLLSQHRDVTAVFAANNAMPFGAIRAISV